MAIVAIGVLSDITEPADDSNHTRSGCRSPNGENRSRASSQTGELSVAMSLRANRSRVAISVECSSSVSRHEGSGRLGRVGEVRAWR